MTHTADSLADSGTRVALDALAETLDIDPAEYATKADLAAAILDADPDAVIAVIADDDDDADVPEIVYQRPGDSASAPVRDFAYYADAVAQSNALGGDDGDVEGIGTAFHVGTNE